MSTQTPFLLLVIFIEITTNYKFFLPIEILENVVTFSETSKETHCAIRCAKAMDNDRCSAYDWVKSSGLCKCGVRIGGGQGQPLPAKVNVLCNGTNPPPGTYIKPDGASLFP